MADAPSSCFHCGEPLPENSQFTLVIDDQPRAMCCAGCLAVAELIRSSGLERYYQYRSALARKAGDDIAKMTLAWQSVDDNQSLWGFENEQGAYELMLQTEGIHCAACSWLIRSQVSTLPGIDDVQVDAGSGFTHIIWRPSKANLSNIAQTIMQLGYKPHLPVATEEERARRIERHTALKRLGVAGLGMMQVMMYAVGLYAGDAMGIESAPRRFLEWVSLLVTTPVLLYSGRPFIEGAIRGIRLHRPGMDLPVALAIVGAFIASTINFFTNSGEVWFDSVVMFIFFLSLARYIEMSIRHSNQQSGSVLARLLPEWAEKITAQGTSTVAIADLQPGDRVRVLNGDAFPADAIISTGTTEVNEAILSGESFPIPRGPGDAVYAGSVNTGQPVEVLIQTRVENNRISALGRLLQKAQRNRAESISGTEKYATGFVVGVIILAGITALYWLLNDATQAIPATLAVLVVSCPCAFSLASPSVIAAASKALLTRGVILRRGTALEKILQVDNVIFDKTGTLTAGMPAITNVVINSEVPDGAGLAEIAAALERYSSHPVAQAFSATKVSLEVTQAVNHPGKGVSGTINGRSYRVGNRQFVLAGLVAGSDAKAPGEEGIWLADETRWLAVYHITDELREGAKTLINDLNHEQLNVSIVSGDHPGAVARVATALGVKHWKSRYTPEQKLEFLAQTPAAGKNTLMVGDGVNDAPVLAAAGVSISVQGATDLANAAADFILTGRSLQAISEIRSLSRKAQAILHQNLWWAIGYNTCMIPLAFSGILRPWMAAIGMSASSLLVVLNAKRIR